MSTPSYPSVPIQPHDWIAGLERGFKVLEIFNAEHSRLSAQQVAELAGLTRTAARRHLLTLAHLGYLHSDGKLFWLSHKVLRLGQAFMDSSRLVRLVQPALQRAAVGLQETVYLSALDGETVIYLARFAPTRSNASGYGLGERIYAPLTAAGAVQLSYLGEPELAQFVANYEIRHFTPHSLQDKQQLLRELSVPKSLGYALSERQLDIQYRGIAVPLLDSKGVVHGALSVTMPIAKESSAEALQRVMPLLRDTAQSLRKLL